MGGGEGGERGCLRGTDKQWEGALVGEEGVGVGGSMREREGWLPAHFAAGHPQEHTTRSVPTALPLIAQPKFSHLPPPPPQSRVWKWGTCGRAMLLLGRHPQASTSPHSASPG